jgi:hypothetical protein
LNVEADWEVEIGGDAPVIDAHWSGFVDLRASPERMVEIAEVRALPPLANLLLALNSKRSLVRTSKCDVWEPGPGARACYVDLLPVRGGLFAEWERAEAFCRVLVKRIAPRAALSAIMQPAGHPILPAGSESEAGATILLVVRRAITGQSEGFGVTAYFSAEAQCSPTAVEAIARAMVAFSNALVPAASHAGTDQS